MRSTIFDSRENENTAAAEILITPAIVVASSIESSVGLILNLGETRQQIINHGDGDKANREAPGLGFGQAGWCASCRAAALCYRLKPRHAA
jgi:hypothetical protein